MRELAMQVGYIYKDNTKNHIILWIIATVLKMIRWKRSPKVGLNIKITYRLKMEFNSVHIAHGEHCSFFWFPLIYI